MKRILWMILTVWLFILMSSFINRSFAATSIITPEEEAHHNLIWQESNTDFINAEHSYAIGDDKSAEEWALKAVKAAPMTPDGSKQETDWSTLPILAKIYLKQGKNAEVVKLYEGLDLSRVFNRELLILALANVRLGNTDTALMYYNDKRLTRINYRDVADIFKDVAADFPGIDTPKDLEASLLLTYAQSGLERFDVYDALKQAHALLPSNPLIALQYGDCFYRHLSRILKPMDMAVGVDKDTAKNDAADYANAIEMFNFAIAHGHDGVRKEALAKLDQIKQNTPQVKAAQHAADLAAYTAARLAAQKAGSATPAKAP
jgi:tetratricopeptide (TPR) repeat protein